MVPIDSYACLWVCGMQPKRSVNKLAKFAEANGHCVW
eukprot:CAMPEP_0172901694 /NCGR_PEP_ID=MMETSP1075-20121228/166808_1 /TAXON_ID=2916 /ORGANISM="Ceratium fusus, Strain PA161109" /LENGTH=36 /DNA_ID= /DNA_START= /DNA_END= /DNA_ORIENTATION=